MKTPCPGLKHQELCEVLDSGHVEFHGNDHVFRLRGHGFGHLL